MRCRFRSGLGLIAAAALLAAPIHNAGAQQLDPESVNRILTQSVVRIEARDCEQVLLGTACQNGISSSGYFVELNGELLIATTLHGVAYYPQLSWISLDGNTRRDSSIVRVNTKADLALLSVLDEPDIRGLGFTPLAPLDTTGQPLAGQSVISLGYKLGLAKATAETGTVRIAGPSKISELLLDNQELDDDLGRFIDIDTDVLQLQNRLDPGDSGGPILLGDRVAGIAHGGLQGSSINWAIPVAYLASATDDEGQVNRFKGENTSRRIDQAVSIRLFNTDDEVTIAQPIRLPLRYTFALRLSTRTRLLQGYASRVGWTTTFNDNEGDWPLGDGPIAADSKAYPGASRWRDSEAGAWERQSNGDNREQRAIDRSIDEELRFLELLGRAVVRLECQTDDRLGVSGKPYWPEDDPSLRIDHNISLSDIQFARSEGSLFVYTQSLQEIAPFGRYARFDSNATRGGALTDIDLRLGICAVSFVPTPDHEDDAAALAPLNDSLIAGGACFAIYLPDGAELQLFMVGQSFYADLDPRRLYATIYTAEVARNSFAEPCDG
jgi:hypothetical protein